MSQEPTNEQANNEPTPVWTPTDAAVVFRQAEYTLHIAAQHAHQLTQRLHNRGDIVAASVCDARCAILFRASMIAAAMTQDALREADLPPPAAAPSEHGSA